MDLSRTSNIKRRFVASLSSAATEKLKNTPLSTAFVYLRPSSPSNPLLPVSSSLCANTSKYLKPVIGQTHGTKVVRVSSTTSVASQSLSTPTTNTMSTDSLTHASVEQRVVCERADMDGEMYDPFYPTDGVKGDEGKCEKYDPFDPTGSPTSEIDGRCGKVGGVKRNSELGDDDLEEPPDSTDALTGLSSPCRITAVAWRQRVDSNSTKAQKTDSDDSDHSEIEEGEIIGLTDRNGSAKRSGEDLSPLSSTRVSFLGSKPERILRVLDGDGFVSVRTEANWKTERQTEDEPAVEVEDLRSKLVSRRKERYLSYPPSSSLSPQAPLSPSNPLTVTPPTHFAPHVEQSSKKYKFSKSSMDTDRSKSKNKNPGEKEERKKKKRKKEEGIRERCKDKDREQKEDKRSRNSRSSSRKARKRHHSGLEVSRTWKSEKKDRIGSFLSHSEEGKREGAWNIDRDNDKDKDRHRGRDKYRGRERERERNHTSSRRRDEREKDSSSQKKNKEIKGRHHSSSREHGKSKRSKRSREKREIDKDAQRDREWRRDGRPVVPPSIQDLNGSDLFAIKRTITVTTTTTTTTVPGSPRLAPASPCRPTENSTKPHKKKKRKWHSVGEVEDCCSQSQTLSPPRYHTYESDHYSDKLEIDVLSLDGEALDSDYPSLEDTPPAPLPPEPPVPSPKTKTNPKTVQHHVKKKLQLKKNGQSESSLPSRSKSKCTSSLMVTSRSATVSSGLGLAKRARKISKEKDRDKGSRKSLVRSGKLKKEGGRKSKLQSKVSVLVREGVSSTTGPSVGSGKMGIDLLGPGGTSGGSGSSVVGGSIAVVFCRDNESRSPFLKPCSEPLSLSSRSKDLASMEKQNRLAAPSSLSSPARLKPKKTKQSSITSTSSLASSPSSSLANKGRRRTGKKNKEKSEATGSTAGDVNQIKTSTEVWSGASIDVQSPAGEGRKSVSPHTNQVGPAPCSSSASSSISVFPPLSSPPHTPPPSTAPLQDTRESSPDSQTVDSSCKTPDPSFLAEECPSQTSPNLPASGPPSISISHGSGLNISLSTPTAKSLPPDNASKSLISPPCLPSSAGCGLSSLSLPLSSSDPSSSSVSSSSASKPPPPLPPTSPALPWSLQTGVDCTTGGVLALTALLFKMEEANIASRAKAQEFIQATSQILSQANQNQSQHQVPVSSASTSQIPPPPTLPPPPGLSPAQFILHSSLPLVGCTKTPPSLLHTSIGGGCAQTPPSIMPVVLSGVSGSSAETGWDNETKDPEKYLKKLHTQERAVEEVKLAIKPYYQRKDINKDEYKDILRKAVHKICHSRTGEINPVKVSNLVKLYVQRYKYFRKHGRKMGEEEKEERELGALHSSA